MKSFEFIPPGVFKFWLGVAIAAAVIFGGLCVALGCME